MRTKVLMVLLYVILIFFFRFAGDIVSEHNYPILVWTLIIYYMLVVANILVLSILPRKSTDSPFTWQKGIYLAIPVIYWVGLGHLAILNAYDPEVYVSRFDTSIVYVSALGMIAYVAVPAIIYRMLQSIRSKKDTHARKGL